MVPASDSTGAVAVTWALTCTAVVLMGLRLVLRRMRHQHWVAGDVLTVAAVACVLVRAGLAYSALVSGTTRPIVDIMGVDPDELSRREIGSKLVLAANTVYCTYIWIQKAVTFLLYRRLLAGQAWARYAESACWATLAVFFVVVQIVTLTECIPLAKFWKAPSDMCSAGLVQLTVFAALSITTDILVMLLPIPMLAPIFRPTSRRPHLIILFSISLLVAISTAVRLAVSRANPNDESLRAILVAVEALAAALVANVPTLYTLRSRRASSLSLISSVDEMTIVTATPPPLPPLSPLSPPQAPPQSPLPQAPPRARLRALSRDKDDTSPQQIRVPTPRPALTLGRLRQPLPPLPLRVPSVQMAGHLPAADENVPWPVDSALLTPSRNGHVFRWSFHQSSSGLRLLPQ